MKNSVILFLHGGPGLSSSYFGHCFDELKSTYDLFFYDQNYNKSDNDSILETLVDQFINIYIDMKSKYEEIVIYSHSWGDFILLKAAPIIQSSYNWEKVKRIIISNPADLSWDKYEASGERLFDGASEEEINSIISCEDGIQMMNLALPYYVGDKYNIPSLEFDRYDLEAYEALEAEMMDYDLTDNVNSLPLSITSTIYCEKDFETKDGSMALANNTQVFLFQESGHFPFAEKNEPYINLIRNILE